MPIIATGNQKQELEKRIDAQVLSGISLWSLDNVTMPIGGDAICQAIERPLYGARILAKSETRTVRNTWSIFITGNALKIKNDATRRILRISLDAKQEKPEYRKFKRNPYLDVLRDRGRYLWAALTVVRAYTVAGKPSRLLRLVNHSALGPTSSAPPWSGSTIKTPSSQPKQPAKTTPTVNRAPQCFNQSSQPTATIRSKPAVLVK